MLFAMTLEELFQVLSGFGDVFPQRLGGNFGVFCFASLKKLAMGFACAVLVACHDKMQARITVAVDVQGLGERKHFGPIRGRVERGVETPVPTAPGLHLRVLLERFLVVAKDVFRALKMFFGQFGYGAAKHVAFQHRARFKQFHNLFGRERGNYSAAISHQSDQAFGSQMGQRLPDRDAADLEFRGDGVLAKLFAFAEFAA